MSGNFPFQLGKWIVFCDRCGFKRYNTEVMETWDHLIVCKPEVKTGCWEPRHEQDFLRARTDKQGVAFTRRQPTTDVFRTDIPAVNCNAADPVWFLSPVAVNKTADKGIVNGPLVIESGASLTINCSLEIG